MMKVCNEKVMCKMLLKPLPHRVIRNRYEQALRLPTPAMPTPANNAANLGGCMW